MKRNIGLGLALVAAIVSSSVVSAQGFARTDVTNNGTHLILNGTTPINDADETDFEAVDIDMDGDLDVVIGRKTPFTTGQSPLPNCLLINDGAGHFTDMTSTYTTFNVDLDIAREVKARDMNNDGWPDVVTFNTVNQGTFIWYNLGNDAMGNWLGLSAPSVVQFGTTFNICGGEILDYDADGWMDLFRVDYQTSHESDLLRQDPSNPGSFIDMTSTILAAPNGNLAIDNGFGTRAQAWDASTGAMLDFNDDGNIDLLTAESGGSQVSFTDGVGGWIRTQNVTESSVYDAIAADFDGDGRQDVIKVTDGLDIFRANLSANPDGTYNEGPSEVVGTGSTSSGFGANPSATDFDNDGDLDLFVTPIDVDIPNCSTRRLILYENTGASGAQRFVEYTVGGANPMPMGIYDVVTKDFDGDGIDDILMSGCATDPGYKYWVSDPNATVGTFEAEFIPQPNGSKIFSVKNVPQTGGGRRLYNFFDLNTSYPLGTGAFIGLDANVIGQVQLGFPFVADLAQGTNEFNFTISAFAVQSIPSVRQRTVMVDFLFGGIQMTDIIEEN